MKKVVTAVAGVAVVVLLALGVVVLRNATQSRHHRVAPDSRIELVVHASSRGEEAGQSLDEMVSAKILTCRFQGHSDPVGPVEAVGTDGEFRAVLTPAMDRTDRRQFTGCLQDWSLDHLRVRVLRLEEL